MSTTKIRGTSHIPHPAPVATREPFARVAFWGGYAVNPDRIEFRSIEGAQQSAHVLRALVKARKAR